MTENQIKNFLLNVEQKTLNNQNNIISLQDKKEEFNLYDDISVFLINYAKQHNLCTITFKDAKGNTKILFQSRSFIKELTKKAMEEELDLSFIDEIRRLIPNDTKLNYLLIKLVKMIMDL
jgi:hypothetical protein